MAVAIKNRFYVIVCSWNAFPSVVAFLHVPPLNYIPPQITRYPFIRRKFSHIENEKKKMIQNIHSHSFFKTLPTANCWRFEKQTSHIITIHLIIIIKKILFIWTWLSGCRLKAFVFQPLKLISNQKWKIYPDFLIGCFQYELIQFSHEQMPVWSFRI